MATQELVLTPPPHARAQGGLFEPRPSTPSRFGSRTLAPPASKAQAARPAAPSAPADGEQRRVVQPYVKVLAGMAGGLAEACALQPLDVTKTRLQLDRAGRYTGMWNCGRTILAEEGASALYKGLTPFVTHLMLKYALRFGSFQFYRRLMGAEDGQASAGRDFAAGLASGLTEAVVIVTPFEVIKTRLQQQFGTTNLKYRGPMHAAVTIVRQEGPQAMWKGCTPTMIRQGSNQAFNFMAFAYLNTYLWGKREGDGKRLEDWKVFLNGLIASCLGPCLNSPVDVIKTRLQAQETVRGQEPKYKGVMGTVRTIVAEEGAAALWKGLTPRLMRLAPGQAITWTVVMRVTSMFEAAGSSRKEASQ